MLICLTYVDIRPRASPSPSRKNILVVQTSTTDESFLLRTIVRRAWTDACDEVRAHARDGKRRQWIELVASGLEGEEGARVRARKGAQGEHKVRREPVVQRAGRCSGGGGAATENATAAAALSLTSAAAFRSGASTTSRRCRGGGGGFTPSL